MIIDKIVFVKKLKSYTVYLDNGEGFEIIEDTLVKFNLYKGMEIESDTLDLIKSEDLKFKAVNSVIRFIQNKKTVKEVKEYLSKKGYSSEIIEKTCEYLISKDYINDKKYAKAFINDKLKINKYGRNKIKNSLIQRGIDSNIIESAMYSLDEDIEIENLKYHAEKKYNLLKKDKNMKPKLINHLLYKGYSYDMIKSVISNMVFEVENE